MNFKESYQEEMNKIKKPAGITEKVLNAVDMEQETYESRKNRNFLKNSVVWKTAVAAIAIVCVLSLWQHEKVTGFAQSIVDRFTLSVNNKENIDFGKIKPINMDVEAFINDAETESLFGGGDISYWQLFASYQEMNQLTKLEFPCADKVTYKEIMLDIQPEYHVGHLSMYLDYQGIIYGINGMFTLEGYDQENWGYGDTGKKEIYEYGDGKKACLVKTSEGYEKAYFEEGDILFQMFFNIVNDNDDMIKRGPNKAQAKQLLDLFGSEN